MRRSIVFMSVGLICLFAGLYGTGSEIKDAVAMIACVVFITAAGICQLLEGQR